MKCMPSLGEWISKGNVGPPTNGGTFNNLNFVFKLYTIVLCKRFRHKLNYFVFCQENFKIFFTHADILNNYYKINFWITSIVRFEL
jgi:hypothetical protein